MRPQFRLTTQLFASLLGVLPAAAQLTDRTELRAYLIANFEFAAALEEEFPIKFEEFIDFANAAPDLNAAKARARDWGRQFGQSNAPLLRSAPSDVVRVYLSYHRARIATVRNEIGDARCSRWNAGDPKLQLVLEERFSEFYSAMAVVTIRAQAAALDRPVRREMPTEEQWSALRATFPEHRLDELMVAALTANEPENSAGCEANIRAFDAVLAFEGSGGEEIRAALAARLALAASEGEP